MAKHRFPVAPFPGLTLALFLWVGVAALGCDTCGKQEAEGGSARIASFASVESVFDAGAPETGTGFFRNLLSADFMPHGHCYFWKPEIVWLHVLSDLFIAIAYFSIPGMLLYFVGRRRQALPFPWMFAMFAGFIFWCGATHVLSVVTLWYPVYRLDGMVKAITAAISVTTAALLFPLIPKALMLRSPHELEEINRELEETNRDLEEANRKIRESERIKDDLLVNVSHELRTPLTLIIGPVESSLSGDYGQLADDLRRALQTVHNNAIRLLQMIIGLLDYARLQSGKQEVRREPTNVVSLTTSILGDFEPLMKRRGLEGSLESSVPDPCVAMDRYLFERVLFNLLSNAVKFTGSGGNILVSLSQEGDRLFLSVRDSGIGILPEDVRNLFRRFHQLESSSTRRFEGTGLGLALVQEFATLLGGKVMVQSERGKGSLFVVEMAAPPVMAPVPADGGVAEKGLALAPRYPGAAAMELARSVPAEGELPRVLIAEDNEELAGYMADVLGRNYDTRLAADGNAALTMVRAWRPDLVISDVMMPGMDGLTLCRAIKRAPGNEATTPFILLTALTDRESLLRGWEAGADEYIFKPFHPRELHTRVRTLLEVTRERARSQKESLRREEMEQFAYLASHDLKEPLRGITTFAQLLQRRFEHELGAEGAELIDFVVGGARRMHQMVDDLTSYALLGETAAEPGPVSTSKVLSTVLKNLQIVLEETGTVVTHDELPVVPARETMLVELFQNLIANAVKFRGEKPSKIHVGVEELGAEWLFSVRDNGIGFEPQFAERIFLVFKRLHDRQTYPGNGIGLSICKRIVERHGGRIWAESEPGKGSVFRFTLRKTPSKESGAPESVPKPIGPSPA